MILYNNEVDRFLSGFFEVIYKFMTKYYMFFFFKLGLP